MTNDPWRRELTARVQRIKSDGEKTVEILTVKHEYLRPKAVTGIVDKEPDVRKRKIKQAGRMAITITRIRESEMAEVAWWSHFAES